MTEGRQQRSLKNLKMTRRYRFQFLGAWMVVLTVLIVMLNVSIYINYSLMWESTPNLGADFITRLAHHKWFAGASMLILSAILLGTMTSLALFSGHRIGGPYIALKRTMNEIRDGNYDARLHFREYDRMDDVQDLFNQTMDVMQAEVQKAKGTTNWDEEEEAELEVLV